ncbi:MAG: hypothetical protein M1821_002669 [Bathelium mastoideum]|nr:MAG: hypothetical protein M1821_002669 [Bathelium mastoideum]
MLSAAFSHSIQSGPVTFAHSTANILTSNGQNRSTASARSAELSAAVAFLATADNPAASEVTSAASDHSPATTTAAVIPRPSASGLSNSSQVSAMLSSVYVAVSSATLVVATLASLVTSEPSLVTSQPSLVTSLPPIVSLNSQGLPTTLTTSSASHLSSSVPSQSTQSSTRSAPTSETGHRSRSVTESSTKHPASPTGRRPGSSTKRTSSNPTSRTATRPSVSSTPHSSSNSKPSHHTKDPSSSSNPTASDQSITTSSFSSSSSSSSPSSIITPSPSSSSPGSFTGAPGSPSGSSSGNPGPGQTPSSAQPSQTTAPPPTAKPPSPGLTNSAIAGISAGSISGALIIAVAGLFFVRRYATKRKAAANHPPVYPEEAYLYDPPMPQVVHTTSSSSLPQLPPVRSHTPFGSASNLASRPPADGPRSSFESIDLASAPIIADAPLGPGNTDSFGGISAHDWATEQRPRHPAALNTSAAAAAAAGYYHHRNVSEQNYNSSNNTQRPGPIVVRRQTSAQSLPSPVTRVLEAHGDEPRPLHPLEREMALERAASVSTMGDSEGSEGEGEVPVGMAVGSWEERSPLMAFPRPPVGRHPGVGREEMWFGSDGYQRVETHDV